MFDVEELSQYALLEKQVRLVYQNIRNGWVGLLILLGGIMYIAASNDTDTQVWSIVTVCVALGHGLLVQLFLYRDRTGKISNYKQWGRVIASYSLLAGLMVSFGACLAFNDEAMGWNYFLVALMIMPGFGSAVTSASFLIVHICWVLGTNLPVGLYLLSQGDEVFHFMGLLIVFAGMPMMIILGVGYSRIYQRNIALQLHNLDLVQALKKKADAAQQANLDKSRFLAATSHDLRQPLHALDLLLGAMSSEISPTNQSELNELLIRAKHSSQALGELLNTLLDVSRLDAGEVMVNWQVIDLPSMIQELADECCLDFEQTGRDLRLKVLPVSVQSDPVLLMQLLRNLVVNAIKHTDGNVLIGAHKRGEFIRIGVWDQGNGISKDDQKNIFSEFFQMDNPERDRNKGLGLGLSIVNRISGLLNHPVYINSHVGRGSCFAVDVPSISLNMTDLVKLDSTPDMNVAGIFALVIDDEAPIREGMLLLLRSWDCEVLCAASGDEALHELQGNPYPPPDILIIDYRLRHGKTGTQVATQICSLFGIHIPTIIISGDTHVELADTCRRLHYTLMRKPADSDMLKRKIDALTSAGGI